MRKILFLPFAVLTSLFWTLNLSATEVPFAIKGRILKIYVGFAVKPNPSGSIVIEIEKSKAIDLPLREIQTLAILDSKELTDGVGTAAAVGGAGGVVAAGGGVVNPPTSLQGSKIRNAGLVGVTVAALSAVARAGYNYLTQKPPMVIYDADNENLDNASVIYNLPVGTKVKIVQKNHINGSKP